MGTITTSARLDWHQRGPLGLIGDFSRRLVEAIDPTGLVSEIHLRRGEPTPTGTAADLGSGAGLVAGLLLPGPGKLKVAAKGAKFFKGFANRNAFGESVRQIGRFTEFSVSVPGSHGKSFTRYVKVVNEEGRTIRFYHDTFENTGRFINRGFGVPGPYRHVP